VIIKFLSLNQCLTHNKIFQFKSAKILIFPYLLQRISDKIIKIIKKKITDGPSQAFADTPIGQSLLKLDESQRKRLESLFNTAIDMKCTVKGNKNSGHIINTSYCLIEVVQGLKNILGRPKPRAF
jgi:hypothetical protein